MSGTVRRLSVSEITTVHASFEEDVEAYAAAGVGGIGVWETKLAGQDYGAAAARVRAAGLRVTNVIPEGNSIFPTALSRSPTDPARRAEQLLQRLAALAPLEPESIVLVTGVDPHVPAEELRARCVRELRRVVLGAAELSLPVTLEPMHASAAEDFSPINSLREAARMIEDVGEPGLTILFDTWHMGQAPDAIERLREHVALIGAVHVADVRKPTRSWADRAFPGEGTLPLEELIAALEAGGFGGSYDVEIFSDDGTFGTHFEDSLWDLPRSECLQRATALLRRTLAQQLEPTRQEG